MQILMNVLLTMENVNMNVLTMSALTSADVEEDTYSPTTGDHALVYSTHLVIHLCDNYILKLQILMNAAQPVPMTVTMSVLTQKAPTHVPVTVDSY